MQRLTAVPAIVFGLLIGWLVAAFHFLHTGNEPWFLALFIQYLVIAWELRWWHEIRVRMPMALLGGAILLQFLRPRVYARFHIDSAGDLFRSFGPFSDVNWSLVGATIVVFVVLMFAPLNPHDARFYQELQQRGYTTNG